MYIIDQEVANKIAQTEKLVAMQTWFQTPEEEMNKMEEDLIAKIETEDGQGVGTPVVAFLPLMVESKAITRYINRTKDYSLRMMMPEILTVREATLMAEREFFLMPEQVQKVEDKLSELWTLLLKKNKRSKTD